MSATRPSSVANPQSAARWLWLTVAAMTFLAVPLAATWPLATEMSNSLPMGCEGVATVPLLNLWTVWWNAESLQHGLNGYWDAPIFWPSRSTFAFSEAQPTTLVVAPLVWTQARPFLAYNVYQLLTLVLNGACAWQLLRRWNCHALAALVGGVMMQLLPFVMWQFGVLQLTAIWPILWTLAAASCFFRQPSWRAAFELGAAYGVTYAACNYYGLFLAILLPTSILWFANPRWIWVSSWGQLGLAALVAILLVSPIVVVQQQLSREHSWHRDLSVVRGLSAHLRDYTDAPWPQWLDALEVRDPARISMALGPGLLKCALAPIAILAVMFRRTKRRETLFIATVCLFAIACSLGPHLELWNLSLYQNLRETVPGYAQIRSPFRFAAFVQIAIVLLAALAIDVLLAAADGLITRLKMPGSNTAITDPKPTWRRYSGPGLLWLLAVVASIAVCLETLPTSQRLYVFPKEETLPSWVEYLRNEVPAGEPIACLPFARGANVDAYESTALWMYWSMYHEHPLLDGYSGYFPESFLALKQELDRFPDSGAKQLQELGTRIVVVDRTFRSQGLIARHPQTAMWEWQFSDDVEGIDIYQISTQRKATPLALEQP